MSFQKIEISASVNAPVEVVWRCWNEPEHIVNWNFASDDWCCPRATNNLTVGGKLNVRMEAKDGSFGFDLIAVYLNIVPLKLLVTEFEDKRNIQTTFESHGHTTDITTVFDAESQNPIEMQRDGWQAILNNFKAYAESVAKP